jgi:hypothetical protein
MPTYDNAWLAARKPGKDFTVDLDAQGNPITDARKRQVSSMLPQEKSYDQIMREVKAPSTSGYDPNPTVTDRADVDSRLAWNKQNQAEKYRLDTQRPGATRPWSVEDVTKGFEATGQGMQTASLAGLIPGMQGVGAGLFAGGEALQAPENIRRGLANPAEGMGYGEGALRLAGLLLGQKWGNRAGAADDVERLVMKEGGEAPLGVWDPTLNTNVRPGPASVHPNYQETSDLAAGFGPKAAPASKPSTSSWPNKTWQDRQRNIPLTAEDVARGEAAGLPSGENAWSLLHDMAGRSEGNVPHGFDAAGDLAKGRGFPTVGQRPPLKSAAELAGFPQEAADDILSRSSYWAPDPPNLDRLRSYGDAREAMQRGGMPATGPSSNLSRTRTYGDLNERVKNGGVQFDRTAPVKKADTPDSIMGRNLTTQAEPWTDLTEASLGTGTDGIPNAWQRFSGEIPPSLKSLTTKPRKSRARNP